MTSKEQAEELARECETVYVKNPEIDMAQAVMLAVPIAELLEVAKAATKISSEDTYDERLEFYKAIEALRATGKVKL